MTKKIPVKNLYLIAIISIGLIGLAVGSTYAMFTATAEINNPISLSSNLTYTSDIVETMDVTVAPGETEYVVLDVTNSTDSTLNYAIWYIDEGYDIDFGTDLETPDDTTSGSLSTGSYFSIGVYIRNNGTSNATVTLGISSSSGNIVLADNMKILPNDSLPGHTVTIKKQLGNGSATTVNTLTIKDGNNSSVVSVTGTSSYPTYESISCTNSQTASVTKTTSNGIDTAKVTVNNVTSDTVCTAKFSAPTVYYSVQIKKQVDNGTSTLVETKSVASGGSYSTTVTGGQYYSIDSVSCTNSQTATVKESLSSNQQVNANFSITNVTNNTVCTIKMTS